MVIVLGLLGVVAMDHLDPWPQRLREAQLSSALAAVRTASQLHHLRCLQSGARPCRVTLADGTEVADAHGYPAASGEGIARAANLAPMGLQWRRADRHELPVLTIHVPTPSGAGCSFTYVQASVWGAQPGIDDHRASCR
ncbi:MAG: hypothetical protein U1F56_12400 [Rubrivivax sp.]